MKLCGKEHTSRRAFGTGKVSYDLESSIGLFAVYSSWIFIGTNKIVRCSLQVVIMAILSVRDMLHRRKALVFAYHTALSAQHEYCC